MKVKAFILTLSGFLCVSLTFGVPVRAQTDLNSCADIDDAQERLSCYDRAVENAENLPVVRLPRSSRPETTAGESSSRSADTADDDFGLEDVRERERRENARNQRSSQPDNRSYRVVAATHNDFTGWTIEFEGGGTWKQVGTDPYDIEVGQRYTIRRTSFRSYMLSNSKNNKKIRIARVE